MVGSRIEELKAMPYDEYLQTPEWSEKREKALRRAEHRCQICNSSGFLHVHHRTYENRGDERLEDLAVLCEDCHKLYHYKDSVECRTLPIEECVKQVYTHLEYTYSTGEMTGVSTGFVDLDRQLGGLQRSDFIIIPARPSVGKTSLCLSIGRNAARHGQHVAIFSLEMSTEQVVQGMVATETGIDAWRLRLGNLQEDEWHLVTQATGKLADLPVFIDDTPSISDLQLRAKAHDLHAKHGLDLVIVDYLQLMTSDTRFGSRFEEVSHISRSLKALARELGVPVVATSQLSRAVEQRTDKRPLLRDLRESGSLEEDADVVILMYRDELYHPDTEKQHIADIIVAKHRNGPTGILQLFFRDRLSQFLDAAICKSGN